MKLRPSEERGKDDKGWLQSSHSFSFESYYDPDYLNFRSLRVLNENRVKPGKGFGLISYKDMEIITYVLEGVLEYNDSLGNSTVIRPGEIQKITAGAGITYSVYNLSHQVPVHYLQIWITPSQIGLEPGFDQKIFSSASKWGQWCLMGSSNAREGSVRIYQDVDLYATLLDENEALTFETFPGRHYWLQVISGRFLVQETPLHTGDGAALSDEESIEVRCLESGELLLLDMA